MTGASGGDHGDPPRPAQDRRYRRILWIALGLNLAMFVVEVLASMASDSISLRADALDFLGDAANYALALAVVGMALRWRASAALLKGAVMGAFGLWVAASTVYHALAGALPDAAVMSAVGVAALIVNTAVAALLYRYRRGESQMLSVWLCTRNDALVSVAVIAAGAGVWQAGTRWPDLAVAAAIAALGLSSALRVTRQALGELRPARRPGSWRSPLSKL